MASHLSTAGKLSGRFGSGVGRQPAGLGPGSDGSIGATAVQLLDRRLWPITSPTFPAV